MFAGCVLPLAAAPAEDCAETVSDVAPPVPLFITTLGAGEGAAAALGGGVSNTGLSTGAGSGFFAGAAAALTGAFDFAAAFFAGAAFLGACFLAGGFFADTGFFFAAAAFLAGAFLGAGFLAMGVSGSDLFQFRRG